MYGKRDVIAYPIKDAVYARQYILNELNARKSFDPYTTCARIVSSVSGRAFYGVRPEESNKLSEYFARDFDKDTGESPLRVPGDDRAKFTFVCIRILYRYGREKKWRKRDRARTNFIYIYRKTVAVDRNETVYDDYRKKRLPNFSFYFLSPPRAPRYLRVNTHTHTQAVRYSFL